MISPSFIENPIRASKKDLVASYIEFKEAYNDLLITYHQAVEKRTAEGQKFNSDKNELSKRIEFLSMDLKKYDTQRIEYKTKIAELESSNKALEEYSDSLQELLDNHSEKISLLKKQIEVAKCDCNKALPEIKKTMWQNFFASIKKTFSK